MKMFAGVFRDKSKAIPISCIFFITFLFFLFSISSFASDKLALSLEECIQIALQENLGYKISQSSVEVKEAQIEEAEGAKKINVRLKAGYVRMNEAPDPESIMEGDFSYLYSTGVGVPTVSLSVSKVLYSGGKIESYISQAEANQSIAINDLEQKKQEVIFQTTQAYYGALKAAGLVKVSEQALTQINSHLETSEALLKEGMIAPIDLNRIKSQLSNLEHNLIRAENGYELAIYNLNSIMGIDLSTMVELQNNLIYEPCEITLNEAMEAAILNRPEVKNISQQRIIMENMVDIAKSNKKPQIVMNLESGLAGWQVAVMGEVPIFDGGVNTAKIKQAELNLSQVDQSRIQIEQMLELEIRSAYLRMKEAEKLIKITDQGIGDSQESFRIAQVKYNEGIATNTEVIDAQSALIEAETNKLNALYEYNTNRASLIKAMGLMGVI
ncbi:MAG: TolC family protein [Candidatus Caldatribacteriota bacterium]|nr:TolC family protein [Atribacterota bacterium]MDD4288337.1 TolC family protein [Atribacterota bacterium]